MYFIIISLKLSQLIRKTKINYKICRVNLIGRILAEV